MVDEDKTSSEQTSFFKKYRVIIVIALLAVVSTILVIVLTKSNKTEEKTEEKTVTDTTVTDTTVEPVIDGPVIEYKYDPTKNKRFYYTKPTVISSAETLEKSLGQSMSTRPVATSFRIMKHFLLDHVRVYYNPYSGLNPFISNVRTTIIYADETKNQHPDDVHAGRNLNQEWIGSNPCETSLPRRVLNRKGFENYSILEPGCVLSLHYMFLDRVSLYDAVFHQKGSDNRILVELHGYELGEFDRDAINTPDWNKVIYDSTNPDEQFASLVQAPLQTYTNLEDDVQELFTSQRKQYFSS